jgi:hypothetical protein
MVVVLLQHKRENNFNVSYVHPSSNQLQILARSSTRAKRCNCWLRMLDCGSQPELTRRFNVGVPPEPLHKKALSSLSGGSTCCQPDGCHRGDGCRMVGLEHIGCLEPGCSQPPIRKPTSGRGVQHGAHQKEGGQGDGP